MPLSVSLSDDEDEVMVLKPRMTVAWLVLTRPETCVDGSAAGALTFSAVSTAVDVFSSFSAGALGGRDDVG